MPTAINSSSFTLNSQTFRDLLHTQYSSSTKAKAKVRQQRRTSLKTTSAEAVSNHPHETSPDYCKSERESPDGVPSSVFVVSDSSTLEQKSVNDYDIIKEKPGCVVVIRRSKRRKMKRRNALDEHDISSAIAIADAVSSSGGIYQYENNKHCSSSPNTEDVSSSVHAHHDIEPLPLEASEVEINFDDESGVNKLILEDSEQSFEESMRNLYYCFHATSL